MPVVAMGETELSYKESGCLPKVKDLLCEFFSNQPQPGSSKLHKCACECVFVSTRELKDCDHNHCSHMMVDLGISCWPRGKCISVRETHSRRECVKKLLDCMLLHHHFLCHRKTQQGVSDYLLYTHMHTHKCKDADTHRYNPVRPSVNISKRKMCLSYV